MERDLRADRRSERVREDKRCQCVDWATSDAVQHKPPTHLVVNEGSQWKVVKQVGKVLPDVGISVLPQALVVETVDLRNLPRLVVAAEDSDPVAIAHLECYEKRHRLHRVVSSVYVVSHEEIIRVWRVATNTEEL